MGVSFQREVALSPRPLQTGGRINDDEVIVEASPGDRDGMRRPNLRRSLYTELQMFFTGLREGPERRFGHERV